MTHSLSPDFNRSLTPKRPKSTVGWLGPLLALWAHNLGRQLGHQASLERLNRLLLGAVGVGFLVTIATYGWVVHQKFTLQQLIQETQSLQESNTARSIHLNRLQSFTGIMKNAQASHWLSEPKETLTLLAPIGQPLPQESSQDTEGAFSSISHDPWNNQRWPAVTGY